MTIGFASGRHLHYTVYLDLIDNDGRFHLQEQPIDPLVALSMPR
jgi:hypothetical protein